MLSRKVFKNSVKSKLLHKSVTLAETHSFVLYIVYRKIVFDGIIIASSWLRLKPRLHQIHVAGYKYLGRTTCIRKRIEVETCLRVDNLSPIQDTC